MVDGPFTVSGSAGARPSIQSKSVAIRLLDGKPSLVIFTEECVTVYELRPAQVLQLVTEAARVAWANFDIVERE